MNNQRKIFLGTGGFLGKVNFLGKGIYSIPYASKLTDIHTAKINRWVKGLNRKDGFSPPIISIDYEPINNFYSISFLDLIELFFVNAFRKHGVSLKHIREIYEKSQEVVNFSHPFSTKKFKTDGKKILYDYGNDLILQLLNEQYAAKELVNPFIFDAFNFEDDVINQLWPLGKNRQVVIDPNRNFGKPVINKEGVSVDVIGKAFKTEKTIKGVAEWFDIGNESVKDAVEYYQLTLAA